jgi:hypothetical protein
MMRNRETPLTNAALYKLGEYIASRPDLDNADPKEIEVALKKAGKLPQGDHYVTAFHACVKAIRIRRRRRESEKGSCV